MRAATKSARNAQASALDSAACHRAEAAEAELAPSWKSPTPGAARCCAGATGPTRNGSWPACATRSARNASCPERAQRRYLGLESLKNARGVLTARTTENQPEEVNTDLIASAINS